MEQSKNILLLDADEQSASDIQRFLKVSAYAFSVSHTLTVEEALNYLRNRKPDMILLDAAQTTQLNFPAFKNLAEREKIPVVLLSDFGQGEAKSKAEAAGASDFLIKNKINLFHLQKTIVNALKLSEAESRLDDTFNDFVSQHESFYTLINRIDKGVLVLNSHNAVRYANAKAYSIMGEDVLRKHLADYVSYREVDGDEEVIELMPRPKLRVSIQISEIQWNAEKCNLFLIDRKDVQQQASLLQNEYLQTLLHSLSESIVLLKGDKLVFANQTALRVLKLKQHELNDKTLSDVFETRENLLNGLSVQSFLSEKVAEGMVKVSDGSTAEVKFTFKPINIDNEFYHLLSFAPRFADIDFTVPHPRSDAEKFSTDDVLHLASHDLREPVRTILNYVQLLSDKLEAKKYAEASEYAVYAKDSAERMERLLTDLKTYIGLNNHTFQLAKTSMKLVLADVLKQLKPRIEQEGAEVSFTELPDVSADRELVEKLLFLLIENALKFRKKDRQPVIDIGYDKFEGNIIFCVRDNGIGISKKYYQRIFSLFERLNRVDEYTGNGLGLAICKKITDMHGGEIWVESLPGSGSNFYFTLKGK